MGGQAKIADSMFVHKVQCAVAVNGIHSAVKRAGQFGASCVVKEGAGLNRFRFLR
jgi:hypothetical protein